MIIVNGTVLLKDEESLYRDCIKNEGLRRNH